MSQRTEKIEQLNRIGEGATAKSHAVAFLQDALYDEDYLIRAKAFLLTERCFSREVRPALWDILRHGEREWQLRAINALKTTADEGILEDLRPYLCQRRQPLLIRAAYLTVAAVGGEKSLLLLAAFLNSPYCAYLKDDFLGDVLAFALEHTANGRELWRKISAGDQNLTLFSDALLREAAENPLLTVYPYPDYLAQMAKAQGFTAAEWKKAMYFPRKKNRSEKNQKRTTESTRFRGGASL